MSVYDDPVLVADEDPREDPLELIDATARNAAAPVDPPYPTYVRYRPAAEELSTEDDWEPDGAPMPAGPPLASAPVRTVITEAEDRDAPTAEEVLEAAVFKSDLHPRWPKGSGKKAGEFMEVGQTFMSGGKRWQIAHIVKGRIYAHEASGDYKHSETRAFDTVHNASVPATASLPTGGHTVEGIAHVDPKLPEGGKTQASNVVVVKPYVDHASHDPSIPIPEGSQLTPEQWTRFGRLDQEHYSELMGRFGKHKPGAAKSHVDASYAAYESKVQELVKKAYSGQYGSSSGYTLSLTGFSGTNLPVHDSAEMAKLREQALALQAEHQAAVQWDLYNRVKAPDVTAIHKSKSWSAAKWHQHAIAGDNKVFSGLSQSFSYRRHFFGQDGIVTPLAIRNVLLSSASAQPIPGSTHFPGELEISVPHQMAMDDRSFVISSVGGKGALSATQMSWFENSTNAPQGGSLAEQLRDSLQNGTYLPPPPAPANISMGGATGKTFVDPPPEMASAPGFDVGELPPVGNAVDPTTLPKDLPWQHLDENGHPKPVTGEHAGAKQGQYFLGLKGTLYYIGHDPGIKTGYPFTIHKIVDGKFNGESFPYNPDMPGYYLEAVKEHKVPTGEEDGGPVWEPHKWVGGTESKFLEQFSPGDKFKVEGIAYEVVGPVPGGQVKIRDLESGLEGKINGDYKSTWLVPHDGSPLTPEGALAAPSFAQGDHVIVHGGDGSPLYKGIVQEVGADGPMVMPLHGDAALAEDAGSLSKVSPQAPKVGMTFSWHEGVAEPRKATVTKVLANGDVQVNLKPGKVVVPADEWAAHSLEAYNPAAHTIGAKVKLRDLSAGDKFHGSAGNQTHRPYEVLAQESPAKGSKTTWVRNLDTGEVSQLSAHKSYASLDEAKDGGADLAGSSQVTPVEVTQGAVGPEYDPSKFEVSGDKATVDQMPVGALWQGASSSAVFKKVAHDDEGSTVQVVHGISPGGMQPGETVVFDHDVTKDGPPLALLKPKADTPELAELKQQYASDVAELHASPEELPGEDPATSFDPAKYLEGSKVKIGAMPPGTIFKTESKTGPKYYQLSQDGTHTTNLLTGKVYEAKPHFKASPLSAIKPGDEVGAPKPLEGVELSTVQPGSLVSLPNGKSIGEVVSHGQTHTYVKAQGSGDVTGIPMHGKTKVQVTAGPVEFVPSPDDAAALADPSTLGPVLGALPENGTHVLPHGTKVHKVPAGYRIEHADGSLGSVQKTMHTAAATALVQDAKAGGTTFQVKAGNPHTESPVGSNAAGKTFGEMPVGSVFSPGHGGPQFTKVNDSEATQVATGQVMGPDATQVFAHDYVPDDVHHEPATQAHVGQLATVHPNPDAPPSLQIGGPQTGHVKKVRDSDGAVQLHGSALWHKPEHTTLHDEHLPQFAGGDQVHLSDGTKGTFVGWTTHPNGMPGAEVDTTGNMDLVTVDPGAITHVEHGTGEEQVGIPLSSKAVFPTPHEQLAKGDTTSIGTLKPGDQFTVDDTGDLWEVVKQPDGAPEEYATIKLAGGSGTAFDSGWYPGHEVTFHAKAGSGEASVAAAPPVGSALDPHSLPDAVGEGGLVPFSEPQGGPWAHSQIGTMPVGAVFEDSAGNVWKVKVAGPTPVVSGGAQHFAVDGALRGKDLSQPNTPAPQHVDMAGPTFSDGEVLPEGATSLVSNPSGAPLSQLDMKPGVFVKIGAGKHQDKVAEFVASYGSGVHGYMTFKGSDGETIHKGHMHVPEQASADAFLGMTAPPLPEPVAVPAGGPPESLHTAPVASHTVKPGQKFTMAPGSTEVKTAGALTGHSGQILPWTDESGGNGSLVSGTTVYVQPEDVPDTAALGSHEPPAPTADPGTLPPVEGPKGFAPDAPDPVLDPNFSPESTLDAFQSRKGPGGIYSYPRLSETQAGQLFTDKSGTDFRVVAHGSAKTVYENVATGAQHSAPSANRVKLTALPPDPGPQLAPVITDLTAKHGSLEHVPKLLGLVGHDSTYASDGKTKHPRLGHLKFGDVAYDANGYSVTFLGSWLDRALVLDHATNEAKLADAAMRVTKTTA